MNPEVQIHILEVRIDGLTGVNTKLHELIQQQISIIHELELKVLRYESSAEDNQ